MNTLTCHWVTVVDAAGRVHVEAVWATSHAAATASHAA
jgi:hypothetical protein